VKVADELVDGSSWQFSERVVLDRQQSFDFQSADFEKAFDP